VIPFNKPFLTGKELEYIRIAVESGKISGDGIFTKKCHDFFENRYGFQKVLLTTSCTDALEMAALLLDIQPGDEVILPSFTFVSTANAFALRGARLIFADSRPDNPNIDHTTISALITPKTKAVVIIHYAGIACDMDAITDICRKNHLYLVEDAAHAIDSYYRKRPLGSLGNLATFSFHETKNVISGEGGLIVINDPQFIKRAEIIREKGTNRSAFFRGEVDKYNWVDIGSSFLPSEIIAAFLFAQLEHLDEIQRKRIELWECYHDQLSELEEQGHIRLPSLPDYSVNNGHMFYLLCQNLDKRTALIEYLRRKNIMAVFHYLSLHQSPFYRNQHGNRALPNSDRYSECLLRLPLFYELSVSQVMTICSEIKSFFFHEHSN